MKRPRRNGDHWLWIGGPVPPGADGITLGSLVIVTARSAADPLRFDELLRHEAVHVRQYRDLGTARFLFRYIRAYLHWRGRGYSHGGAYRRIPFEAEAVWTARQPVP